ncbi:helix-turn-helix transcriptional regulator [Rhodococcus tibetensis]|uniref:Helix-turn-helix domain-containing protein n=1 Tax=Rhodococcus tibetensis TaxID=2965064 RepID=A0ABT1QGZ3_9NOCA|nr:helix-turn-helix domain-containing protein [Rhodococcus sp. FXJ9.536]MCQ4121554.1 helix-turn-helix domain-containing protein [Rhodococcus sp. FXJ9.536]
MSTPGSADPAVLAALSNLDDPLRRRLFEYVTEGDAPVSREQAAAAVEIGRTLAAYHLDKLAAAGLLTVSYQRPPGRGGPGGGRPAKLYTRATTELSLSVPPRDYEMLARLLVSSVEQDTRGAVRAAVNEAAVDAGKAAAVAAGGDLLTALRGCGYLPQVDDDGRINLRNCPFHLVARDHLDVVCGLNLRLVEGVIAGSTQPTSHAELNPRPDRCCVVVQLATADPDREREDQGTELGDQRSDDLDRSRPAPR